jgi:NADPH-dependent curcumin reductase CurA
MSEWSFTRIRDLVTSVCVLDLYQAMVNFGVGKVIDSSHPGFNAGDLVWGMSGWEEYTVVTQPAESLFKINHAELPLSYYTGVLGQPQPIASFMDSFSP